MQPVVAGAGGNVADDLMAAGVVTAVDQHGRALGGQIGGQRPAMAVGGSGDQDGLFG